MTKSVDISWCRRHSVPLRHFAIKLACGLGALLVASAAAGPLHAETLRQALAAAYKYNPRIDAERARLRATDEEIARANSGYRPTISATGDVTHTSQHTVPRALTDGGNTSATYGVNLVQPLFRGFRTQNSVSEAEAIVRAGRESLRAVEQFVLLEAATAFMDVVRDQQIVRLRENNVNVLSRELQATRDRFSVGEVTRTDVALAEARRAGSVSALDLARSNLKISRATFERVVGHPPTGLVDPRRPDSHVPRSQNEAVSISLAESPTVVAALYREQAARFTVDKIWGELLPEIRLEAAYTHRDNPNKLVEEQDVGTITGRVNIPIYAAGETHARVRQAKHTHLSRLQEIEQFRQETRALVIASWSQLVAAKAQLESDDAQVKAARTALTGVREEQKVGQRTILDVLNAEQELLNAEVQLATTRRNVIVTSYSVLSSVGRLTSEQLSLTKLVYDPEVHYHAVRRKWWGISITRPDGRKEHHDLWERHGASHEPLK